MNDTVADVAPVRFTGRWIVSPPSIPSLNCRRPPVDGMSPPVALGCLTATFRPGPSETRSAVIVAVGFRAEVVDGRSGIRAGAAGQRVVAVAAVQSVCALAAVDHVVAAAPLRVSLPPSAVDRLGLAPLPVMVLAQRSVPVIVRGAAAARVKSAMVTSRRRSARGLDFLESDGTNTALLAASRTVIRVSSGTVLDVRR